MAEAGQCDSNVLMWREFCFKYYSYHKMKKYFLLCTIDIPDSNAFPISHLYYWGGRFIFFYAVLLEIFMRITSEVIQKWPLGVVGLVPPKYHYEGVRRH